MKVVLWKWELDLLKETWLLFSFGVYTVGLAKENALNNNVNLHLMGF